MKALAARLLPNVGVGEAIGKRLTLGAVGTKDYPAVVRPVTFPSAAEMLETFGMGQGGTQYRRLVAFFERVQAIAR